MKPINFYKDKLVNMFVSPDTDNYSPIDLGPIINIEPSLGPIGPTIIIPPGPYL